MTYSVKISASYPFVFCILTNINEGGGGILHYLTNLKGFLNSSLIV